MADHDPGIASAAAVEGPRTWLVTGASRGLGRAFVEAALGAGDAVAATARDARTLAGLVGRFPDRALALDLDVTDHDAAREVAARVAERFGRLDVVVNNAGYGLHGAVEGVTEAEARAQLEMNFFGALWVTQAVLPYMRRQGSGHVVQVCSAAGAVGFALVGMYSASKFALEGMSECLAREVAPFGVKVTILEPSDFRTGFRDRAAKRRRPLPAYEEAFGANLDALSARHSGSEAGDPARAARALLALVDEAEPPLRLLLGNMAFDVVTSAQRRRLEEWAAQEAVARAADG
ncbi:MAG TPA: SDR family NAD(P)-dependent oxidoreductase [Acidimicrobiales bacterium]|nr:SDR family NAD(P)-dependent oxidoreductase [Acidimicrobiales bacterium]